MHEVPSTQGSHPMYSTPLLAGFVNHPQYQIIQEIGRGGMGVVYLAMNRLLARNEVLKVVNQTFFNKSVGDERFLREMQAAARLNHANVVSAYAAFQTDGMLVFAMEFVEGDDLGKLVAAIGPLPLGNACYYAYQAALGLQHAFEQGMVHRDIKPQNLMLTRQGKKHVVKILDFGLAKVVRETVRDDRLTATGQMLGTPAYIAPEQILDASRADQRADIYSLGCTLYYLLVGHPPFNAKSVYGLFDAHHSQVAKPLHHVRSDVPEALAAVVSKMMAKDPVDRYQTPAQAAECLVPFMRPVVRLPHTLSDAGNRAACGSESAAAQRISGACETKAQPVAFGETASESAAEAGTIGQDYCPPPIYTYNDGADRVAARNALLISVAIALVAIGIPLFLLLRPQKRDVGNQVANSPTQRHVTPAGQNESAWRVPDRDSPPTPVPEEFLPHPEPDKLVLPPARLDPVLPPKESAVRVSPLERYLQAPPNKQDQVQYLDLLQLLESRNPFPSEKERFLINKKKAVLTDLKTDAEKWFRVYDRNNDDYLNEVELAYAFRGSGAKTFAEMEVARQTASDAAKEWSYEDLQALRPSEKDSQRYSDVEFRFKWDVNNDRNISRAEYSHFVHRVGAHTTEVLDQLSKLEELQARALDQTLNAASQRQAKLDAIAQTVLLRSIQDNFEWNRHAYKVFQNHYYGRK